MANAITTQTIAISNAETLKAKRLEKTALEKECKSIQSNLLEYFNTRKNKRIDCDWGYFSVQPRNTETISLVEIKSQAPHIYQELLDMGLVKKTSTEYIIIH